MGVWGVGWMGGLMCWSMETTWGQHEDNVETTLGQHGDHRDVETTWGQCGGPQGCTDQSGDDMETTWGQT